MIRVIFFGKKNGKEVTEDFLKIKVISYYRNSRFFKSGESKR